jgi:protein ImuA
MDLSALPTAGALARGPHVPRWRPGLGGVRHGEVFASGREASGAAAALALMLDGLRAEGAEAQRALLWVQDAASLRLTGRPYRPGLPPELRRRIVHVAVRTPEDALFALEEGVRCRELAGVIGEIAGNPKALDFTASRRLTLAAERHGVPLMLVRLDAARDLSSARMRWEVAAAPSPPPRWNAAAPGRPSWHAELFRARGHAPGEWILTDDGHDLAAAPTPDHGDLAAAAGDRSLAAG